MSFLAIVRTTPEGRVAKYAEHERRADAEAHAAEHGGFVVPKPAAPWAHWRVDPARKSVSVDAPEEPLTARKPMGETRERRALCALAKRLGPQAHGEVTGILDGD